MVKPGKSWLVSKLFRSYAATTFFIDSRPSINRSHSSVRNSVVFQRASSEIGTKSAYEFAVRGSLMDPRSEWKTRDRWDRVRKKLNNPCEYLKCYEKHYDSFYGFFIIEYVTKDDPLCSIGLSLCIPMNNIGGQTLI